MNGRVLVVDDEIDIQEVICFVLGNAGYQSRAACCADQALQISKEWKPDLVILDIGLPDRSGLDICPALESLGIPVLVLSSHDRDDQVVAGLELGAEDYVTKPFNYTELLLRVGKIIRRTHGFDIAQVIHAGHVMIDVRHRLVKVGGQAVHLTPTEFDILLLLARHRGTPLPVETLLREVWRTDDRIQGDELVKVNIRRLRKKIEPDPDAPRYLLNRRGYGYLLSDDPLS